MSLATVSAVSRLHSVTIDGPAGPLEGLLQEHVGRSSSVVALVCHPHPLHGGTLHNKVVHRAASALHGMGATVLRFNFRGVGASAGQFDHGRGELEDARAALEFLRRRQPGARCWLSGFSFGAGIAARLAVSADAIERLILIAPPVRTTSFEVLRTWPGPKLVVQGTADEVAPIAALQPEFETWAEPKRLIRVPAATHFFDRQLGELAHALVDALEVPEKEAR
jgi:alpha/beta superfamily hydrolase